MWLPEDHALDARLTDAALFERVFRTLTDGVDAPLPHPRAAGVIALLRAHRPELAAAPVAAWAGALRSERVDGLPAPLLHHLHVLSLRVAAAVASARPERAVEARVTSLAAWHALVAERAYLRDLATRVLGPTASSSDVDRAVAASELGPLEDCAREARAGARQRAPSAGLAMRVLSMAEVIADRAALRGGERAHLVARARSLEAAAIGDALAPVEEALAAASAQGQDALALGRLLADVVAVWRWAGQAEQVEQAAVDALTPLAWQVSRERRWRELGTLLAPFEPVVDSLSARVERDPKHIAYAAPCAQMLVFRYEAERDLERGVAALERAIGLCATHRNARVMLAWALCDRALAAMNATVIAFDAGTRRRVEADLARAESLWPETARLAEARARLARGLGGT